ncbi:MAG TPA: hypothetical protein VFC33_09540 [Acidimicrobiia bacterium]|nr:hypothetical protein [Acidimicrobiia bacterium]
MALTPAELEQETGAILPERDTLSFLHFGSNHSFVLAHNTSIAVNAGFFSFGNVAQSEATQLVFVHQG